MHVKREHIRGHVLHRYTVTVNEVMVVTKIYFRSEDFSLTTKICSSSCLVIFNSTNIMQLVFVNSNLKINKACVLGHIS